MYVYRDAYISTNAHTRAHTRNAHTHTQPTPVRQRSSSSYKRVSRSRSRSSVRTSSGHTPSCQKSPRIISKEL